MTREPGDEERRSMKLRVPFGRGADTYKKREYYSSIPHNILRGAPRFFGNIFRRTLSHDDVAERPSRSGGVFLGDKSLCGELCGEYPYQSYHHDGTITTTTTATTKGLGRGLASGAVWSTRRCCSNSSCTSRTGRGLFGKPRGGTLTTRAGLLHNKSCAA